MPLRFVAPFSTTRCHTFRWRSKAFALLCAAMTYNEFRDRIQRQLARHPDGLTWRELQTQLRLPYDRPCPTWVNELERKLACGAFLGSAGRMCGRSKAVKPRKLSHQPQSVLHLPRKLLVAASRVAGHVRKKASASSARKSEHLVGWDDRD